MLISTDVLEHIEPVFLDAVPKEMNLLTKMLLLLLQSAKSF